MKVLARTGRRGRRHAILHAPAVALLVCAGGCAVGPDYHRPELATPKDYLPANAEVHGSDVPRLSPGEDIPFEWWQAYHNQALDGLVRASLARNPNLDAARAALRSAQESVRVQQAAFYPTADASFAASRARNAQPLASPIASGANVYNLYTAQLSIGYTPDIFGLNRRAVESAQANADMQRFEMEAATISLTANVAVAAIDEAALRDQVRATQRVVDIERQTLDSVRRQRQLGQLSDADVLTQEAALAALEQTLPGLQKQLGQGRDLVANLTGHYPSESDEPNLVLDDFAMPDDIPVTLPSSLIEHRPDVRAAEEALHSASAQIGVAVANRLPNVTLGPDAWGSTALALDRLFHAGTGFWNVSGTASQSVFDGGALAHRQGVAEANYQQAQAQYRATVEAAFQNVADTLIALSNDAKAYTAARHAEDVAQRALDMTRRQQTLGDVSTLVLLQAEQNYQNAVTVRVQAQATRLTDVAALFQALGGGWWHRQDSASDDAGTARQ